MSLMYYDIDLIWLKAYRSGEWEIENISGSFYIITFLCCKGVWYY